MSVVTEARLMRGGGRGGNAVQDPDPFSAGTVPFLVPNPPLDTIPEPPFFIPRDPPIVVDGELTGADLQTAAPYGFGPIGPAVGISHNWGPNCEFVVACSFDLGADEFFDWSANIVGLPIESTDPYDALADLFVEWQLYAATEQILPGGAPILTTERLLGAVSVQFAPKDDGLGDYTASANPAIVLGEDQGYNPVSLASLSEDIPELEDISGCFAPARSQLESDPGEPIFNSYQYGGCREIGLDLSQDLTGFLAGSTGLDESDGLSGEELASLLMPNEFLALSARVVLDAPGGFQFARVFDKDIGFGNGLDLSGSFSTPSDLLVDGVDVGVFCGGLPIESDPTNCIDLLGVSEDPFRSIFNSTQLMRIDVVPANDPSAVPAPQTLLLYFVGLLAFCRIKGHPFKGSSRPS
ncbi:MAG: hypothetical protein AAF098_18020 [Pseudomonadota bacterium]